ncbi:Lin0512 family protein [Desulfogranum japonicum]|uniref:Lin0512 family protein n=1 Tax=Desulfogranum japonicum TaxID=231447 RepID=UPI00041EFE2A|nr:Lin0512 family protein [Desulfogranum japonicum]
MEKKRFIVELGCGMDLHGMDATKAACRAVRDAVGRSCLCGLIEILGRNNFEGVLIDVLVACPFPEQVDSARVLAELPVGTPGIRTVQGGMLTKGICVNEFGEGCSSILVANAAVTVFVEIA